MEAKNKCPVAHDATGTTQIPHPQPPREIPGPKGWPLVGIAPMVGKDLMGAALRSVVEHGGLVRFPIPGTIDFIVAEPELAKLVLTETESTFEKTSPLLGFGKFFLGDGLVFNSGAPWRRQRRLLNPMFSRQAITGVVSRITETLPGALKRLASAAAEERAINIVDELRRIVIGVSLRFIFVDSSPDIPETMSAALKEEQRIMRIFMTRPFVIPLSVPTPLNRRAHRVREQTYGLVRRMVADRRRLPTDTWPEDLLSMLLHARDEEDGQGLSDQLIYDEIIATLVGSFETAAMSLSFSLYLLSGYPEVIRRLENEVDTTLGGRMPTLDDLPRLTLTRMVFEEAMRLYPPLPVLMPRMSRRDIEYNGYRIPAGSKLMISPYALHRNPRVWTNPEAFDPERFDPEHAAKRHKFAYIPFGGGPRMCIGAGLTMIEAPLILASMVQHLRFERVPGQKFDIGASLTLEVEPGIMMAVHRRASTSPLQ